MRQFSESKGLNDLEEEEKRKFSEMMLRYEKGKHTQNQY
jgi:hypothetical protein